MVSGWGRYPVLNAKVNAPRDLAALQSRIATGNAIARGNGRAYGDSAISESNTISMRHFNHMCAFDGEAGQLVAEAGVLLADVIEAFLPRGWFPYVTPGTKFVTLGGMLAADVHGKNHHKDGSFAEFVDWIDLIDASGTIIRCSRSENADLFAWTIGGMGLTGVILRAAIRLRSVESSWIRQRTLPASDLDHAIDLFETSLDATYSVAWIDCLQRGKGLGRSLVMLGEHAPVAELRPKQRAAPFAYAQKRKKTVPIDFPCWSLNRYSVQAFNKLYYWKGRRLQRETLVDWDSYFYPLDAILGWNKIYGRRGFAQFQCAIPLAQSRDGMRALIEATSASGAGSFLSVLKRFGPQQSPFSFPMEGYTLSLDFPVNTQTLALMEQLDKITLSHGGRFYLAKDSRMSRETFTKSESRLEQFVAQRQKLRATQTFQSAQSERLGL
jgi:FAD/FMN-containing dehydrogenase